jgi:hypothetical protein
MSASRALLAKEAERRMKKMQRKRMRSGTTILAGNVSWMWEGGEIGGNKVELELSELSWQLP